MCLYNNDDDDNSNINNNNNSIVIIIIMILRNIHSYYCLKFRWIVAEHSAVINLHIHYSPIVLVYTY